MGDSSQPFYLRRLLEEFGRKQRVNPAYSLRAFARFLGIQPPTLSAVLRGKRALPLAVAAPIARKMGLSPLEADRFLKSLRSIRSDRRPSPEPASAPPHVLNEASGYRLLSEWEPLAILSLMDTLDFRDEPEWIAARLGIEPARAQEAITCLVEAGLVVRPATGAMEKVYRDVTTAEDVASKAIREAHRGTLEMGVRKLDSVPLARRDFSSINVAIDLERIGQAKELIRRFRRDFAEVLEEGPGREVFRLALQFYPLTQMPEGEGEG